MAVTLSRVTDFVPSTPILSAEVDAEFNQLVNLLKGTSTSIKAVIKVNDAGDPPLELDQLGAGPIQEWYQTGILKLSIANSGQIVSPLATGTAPFSVASTTLVSNLNADLLDGLNASQFVRNDNGAQTIAGDLTISDATPKLVLQDTTGGDDDFEFEADGDTLTLRVTGGSNILTVAGGTQVATFAQIPVLPASDPTTANQATRKSYVDAGDANSVKSNVSGQFVTDNFRIDGTAPIMEWRDTTGSAPDWTWGLDAGVYTGKFVGGSDYITFTQSDSITRLLLGGLAISGDLDVSGIIFRTYEFLVSDTTTNTNTNGDLTSFTIPAGILVNNGNWIKFQAAGTGIDNGESVSATLNGTEVGAIGLSETGSVSWRMDVTIVRLNDTTVRCTSRSSRDHVNYNDGASAETEVFNVDVSVNSLSGSTNVFKCASTGTVTQNLLIGEFMRT